MKIGSKVQVKDDGPIYGITNIELYNGYLLLKVKVDNQWYTRFQFHERFKLREDLDEV